jgi:hypothetical protein
MQEPEIYKTTKIPDRVKLIATGRPKIEIFVCGKEIILCVN